MVAEDPWGDAVISFRMKKLEKKEDAILYLHILTTVRFVRAYANSTRLCDKAKLGGSTN